MGTTSRFGRPRAVIVVALLAGMIGVTAPTVAAPAEDEQFPSGHAAVAGLHGIEIDANSGNQDKVSALFCNQTSGGERLGTSVASSPCSIANGYSFRAVLGPCTSTRTVDCIESISSTSGTASPIAGTFSRHFPAVGMNDYTGSAEAGVPDGGPPGLWTLPGAPHAFGSDYLVTAQIVGSMANGDALKPSRNFFASIIPVSIFQTECDVRFNGMCKDGYFEESAAGGGVNIKYGGAAADQDKGYRCSNWGEDARCTLHHAFPAGVSYSLKVRLRRSPSGWLHGRMQNPNATITTDNGVTTVVIEAEPTRVPVVSGFAQWNDLPNNLKEWWTKVCPPDCGGTRLGDPTKQSPTERNSVMGATPYSAKAFELLALFRDFVKDKAAALPGYWSVRTLSGGEMSKAGKCISDAAGVAGIVSTNSALYGEGPPLFNAETKSLDYKVSSPHYEKDGKTEFKGRYNLMIRSDVARCIYGFKNAPISTKIEVIDEKGASAAAVTNMSEKNGWFRLDASGFTFSAPTVRVTMTQDASAEDLATTTTTVATTAPQAGSATPVVGSTRPVLARGKSRSLATIAKSGGLSVPTGAKVSAVVSASSRSKCRIVGSNLRATAKGTCTISVTVRSRTGKKLISNKAIRVTVS